MSDIKCLGALYLKDNECHFEVWAPKINQVEVLFEDVVRESFKLTPVARGYHVGKISGVKPGDRYRFRLDQQIVRPDPASRWQPDGVHGASAIVDPEFRWTDQDWRGLLLEQYVIYELHVGTFTDEGTFAGVEHHLESLRELGITAIELMPVAQFPGTRNWGYDGVYPFAVQDSYGGTPGLKHLVNAAHQVGLAVILDVVYNHLGPEGNYLNDFGSYFTTKYQTPWGSALNFDGPQSDEVRRFFIENALRWIDEFHIDALRLDAIHAIVDNSAYPFIQELADSVHDRAKTIGRQIVVIAETDANDSRICRSNKDGGFGYDAQWSDDLHHALHALLTKEQTGYYADFGSLEQVLVGLRDGYVFQGQYSPFRQRRHGSCSKMLTAQQLVVCAQNHDQIGNRMLGDRLTSLTSLETVKLVAGVVILSPFIPLLFMGEEYGETAPFQYFVDHSDLDLIEAVRRGRREEFAAFSWQGEAPDPQDESTFIRSKLNHSLVEFGQHAFLRSYYRELFRVRSIMPIDTFIGEAKQKVEILPNSSVITVERSGKDRLFFMLLNFAEKETVVEWPKADEEWQMVLNSAEQKWGGPHLTGSRSNSAEDAGSILLSPQSFLLFISGGKL